MQILTRSRVSVVTAGIALALSSQAFAEEAKPDFKFNAVLQNWLFNDTTAAVARPDFRIRRAELRFSGNVTEHARWFVMADVAKALPQTGTVSGSAVAFSGDNKLLQDIGAAYTIIPGLELVVGQFKILTTSESLEKSAELFMPERSFVGRTFGDRREQGAMLNYKMDKFQVGAMVSNDTGPNQADTNNEKDFSLRADVDVVDGIKLGAFTRASDFSYAKNGWTGANVRVGLGDLLVGAEGVLGTLSGFKTQGVMAYAGYSVTQQIQPVIRFSTLNPASDLDGVSSAKEYSVGVNYYVAKHNAKIQLAWTGLDNLAAANGSPAYAAGASGSVTTLNFQAAL